MINVLLVIHLLIAIALIILILLQKSEGAAAGGGFSATAAVNAMMQPRARPNPITRTTTILGICFFASSLGLALLAKPQVASTSIFAAPTDGPAVPKVNDIPVPAIDPAAVPAAPPAAAPATATGESSTPSVPTVPQNP